ncbi:MAG: FliI/YscN family ATPase [Robiginitomaculum sp.]|nr:FliI/YscN family ATPase [Robiginitomaculum sp.]
MQTSLEASFSNHPAIQPVQIFGHIREITAQNIKIEGLSSLAALGDQVKMVEANGGFILGEIITISRQSVTVTAYGDIGGIGIGTKAFHLGQQEPRPTSGWIGKILDHSARCLDGSIPPQGHMSAPLKATPPKNRKAIGKRLNTGLAAIDSFLPLCRGQRLGLFSGSGVGKSTLLADLAKGCDADIVILALIGERGREVRDFTQDTLGPKGMKKSIVFVATSDEPPALKLRAAWLAMASAEYFRDQGKHVLLLFDSLTRFAEAHRSIALSAGETPSLRAFPPSTFGALAQLCERAGPGREGLDKEGQEKEQGDITAVFSVLVAGSNMEEPVADMVRGILDGHVVLERNIAERGRYPAIDIRRSVSRALPGCASDIENESLHHARRLIGAYEDARTLISAGLYQPGSDKMLDEAVEKYENLDGFVSRKNLKTTEEAFAKLREILNPTDD